MNFKKVVVVSALFLASTIRAGGEDLTGEQEELQVVCLGSADSAAAGGSETHKAATRFLAQIPADLTVEREKNSERQSEDNGLSARFAWRRWLCCCCK